MQQLQDNFRTNDHRISITLSQKILVAVLLIWGLLQSFAVMKSIPESIVANLHIAKNLTGVAIVFWGIFMIISKKALNVKVSIDTKLAFIAIIFPLYAFFNIMFKLNTSAILETVLFLFWTIALYIVMPSIINTERALRVTLNGILTACLVSLLVSMALGYESVPLDSWYYFSYRLCFDFKNPNTYANTWQVVFAISLYFLSYTDYERRDPSDSKWRKIVLIVLMILALFFIVKSRSRNAMLFCAVVFSSYFVLADNIQRYLKLFLVLLGILLIIGILGYAELDYETINQFSSSRLNIWDRALDINFDVDNTLDYFIGTDFFEASNYHYDGTREGFQSQRAQADNVYLGLFIQYGLFGLILFLFPIMIILRRFYRAFKISSGSRKKLYQFSISLCVGFLFQAVVISIFPSFGNIINIFLLTFFAYPIMKTNNSSAMESRTLKA